MLKRLLPTISSYNLEKLAGNKDVASTFVTPAGTAGTPPRLGTKELLEAYTTMPWLRAVVNKVGKSVGTTNWRLFVTTGSNEDGKAIKSSRIQRASYKDRRRLLQKQADTSKLQEIEDHPLLDLLHFGNKILMGSGAIQVTQQHMDLVGEAFWVIERNGLGVPTTFFPIPPDHVREFPTKERRSYRIRAGAIEIDIPASEVIAFIDPDPANPFGRGTGLAKSLADELETDEYAAKHMKNFFYNDARPSLIISGDSLSPDDTKRLEESWIRKFKGFWNSHKPTFMSRKVDIKELGQSFESMQMLGLRKHERDTILQVYGLPPEKFGIINESKRSTISAADLFWTKDVVLPRVDMIRAVLQETLIPMFDDRLILDFESPIAEDKDYTLSVMQKATWAFTKNEWRRMAGHEDLGDMGDIFMEPVNMVPVDLDEEPLREIGGGDESEEDDDSDTPPEEDEERHLDILQLLSESQERFAEGIAESIADQINRP